jgi:NADH-quinone oxidoreductase subunit I
MIGAGILKGMAVTARNFVGSYFEKDRLITVQYPEERETLPENYRNFPFLIYDTDDPEAGLRCVACKICEKECPPQCIYIIKSEDKKPDYLGKPQFYPATFDIDISVCMSCQICVEVCPFEAIKMDKVFELSRRERFDALLQRKEELSKSNTYYHSIHPIEAAQVDANLAEAAEAAARKKAAAAAAAVSQNPTPRPASAELRRGEQSEAATEAAPGPPDGRARPEARSTSAAEVLPSVPPLPNTSV